MFLHKKKRKPVQYHESYVHCFQLEREDRRSENILALAESFG